MEKKKGFTLIEMMIVVAIIAILSTVATVSMKGRAEKDAKIKAKTTIPMFLSNAIDMAFEEGKSYTINMSNINDSSNPRIELDGKKLILPTQLVYTVDNSSISISERGKLNPTFEIQIKDKKGNSLFKVKGENIGEIDLGKITVE